MHNINLYNTSINISANYNTFILPQSIGLYYIDLTNINYTITKTSKIVNEEKNIITNRQTEQYSYFPGEGYEVDSKYKNARFRGTSITINDLEYDPKISGHRLYIKNGSWQYKDVYRGRIFYRSMDKFKDGNQWHLEFEHYNTLYLMFGPCFTIDNLKDDPT